MYSIIYMYKASVHLGMQGDTEDELGKVSNLSPVKQQKQQKSATKIYSLLFS